MKYQVGLKVTRPARADVKRKSLFSQKLIHKLISSSSSSSSSSSFFLSLFLSNQHRVVQVLTAFRWFFFLSNQVLPAFTELNWVYVVFFNQCYFVFLSFFLSF